MINMDMGSTTWLAFFWSSGIWAGFIIALGLAGVVLVWRV